MMVVLPTSRGVIFIFAAAGSLAIALVNVGLATALAASCLISFVAASFFLALFSLFNINVSRRANRDGVCGLTVQLPLVITNNTFRYRQALVVREKCSFPPDGRHNCAVHPLAPREQVVLDRKVPACKRGFFQLNRITLIGGDPAGLFFRSRHIRIPAEVMIYPAAVNLAWLPLKLKHKAVREVEGRPLGISGQGQEFFGIREYRPGDEIRYIHWRATAAQNRLMVKEFEANAVDRVTILLDCFRKSCGLDPVDNNFEFLIKTAASIANYLSEMYCRVQFCSLDERGELFRLNGDSAGLKTELINALATLQPADKTLEDLLDYSLDMIPPNSIFYCLTMRETEKLQKLFEALMERNIEVRWIYAPAQYFPIVDHEKPRIIKKEKIKTNKGGVVNPYIATFQTDIAMMLGNE